MTEHTHTTQTQSSPEELALHRRWRRERRGFGCDTDPLCPNTASNTITFHPYDNEGVVHTDITVTHQVCPAHRKHYDGLNGYTVIRLAPRCLAHKACQNPATLVVEYEMVHGDDRRPKRLNVCDEHADRYLNRPRTFTPLNTRALKVYVPEEWRDEVIDPNRIPAPSGDPTTIQFIAPS